MEVDQSPVLVENNQFDRRVRHPLKNEKSYSVTSRTTFQRNIVAKIERNSREIEGKRKIDGSEWEFAVFPGFAKAFLLDD